MRGAAAARGGGRDQHDNGSRDQGPPTAACERVHTTPRTAAGTWGARARRKEARSGGGVKSCSNGRKRPSKTAPVFFLMYLQIHPCMFWLLDVSRKTVIKAFEWFCKQNFNESENMR
jgi:hypothetical protein